MKLSPRGLDAEATCMCVPNLLDTIRVARWMIDGQGAVGYVNDMTGRLRSAGLPEDLVFTKVGAFAGHLAALSATLDPQIGEGRLAAEEAGALASVVLSAAATVSGRFPLAWRGVQAPRNELGAFGDPIFDVDYADDADVQVRVMLAGTVEDVSDRVENTGQWGLFDNLRTAALWLSGGNPVSGVVSIVDLAPDRSRAKV